MLVLAFDTATETCSIAIGEGGAVVGETAFSAGRSHLEMLLPEVARLLEENGRTVRDIGGIVTGTGPGTFSGLRVGVATARALSQALEAPLAGSGSLDALAMGLMPAADNGEMVLPVIDARRRQVFSRLYARDDAGKPVPESEIMCLSPADLLGVVGIMTQGKVIAGGNGVIAHYSEFKTSRVVSTPEPDDARHVIRAAHHLHMAPGSTCFKPEDILGVVPVYVREPDADKTVLLRKKEPWLE